MADTISLHAMIQYPYPSPTTTLDLQTAKETDTFLEGLVLTDPENLVTAGRSWRRQVVTSPFTPGNAEVNAVMDIDKVSMTVMVMSSTAGGLQSYMTALVNALSSPTFLLTVEMTGGTNTPYDSNPAWQWTCTEADFTINMNRKFFHALAPEFKIQIERQPVPVKGPF